MLPVSKRLFFVLCLFSAEMVLAVPGKPEDSPAQSTLKHYLPEKPTAEDVKKAVKTIYSIQFNNPDEAIALGEKLIQIPEISPVDKSYAYMGIATSYSIKGQESRAIQYMGLALKFAEKTKNRELRSNTNLALVNIYHKMEMYESAARCLKKAINEISNENDELTREFILMRIYSQQIKNMELQSRYKEGLRSSYNAFAAAHRYIAKRERSDVLPITDVLGILGNTGELFFSAGDLKQAEFFFNKEWSLAKETSTDLEYEKIYTYGSLAKIYLSHKEYKRATDTALAALKDSHVEKSALQAQLYRILAQSYKNLGEQSSYIQYNDRYEKLQQELSKDEKKALNRAVKQMDQFEMDARRKERKVWRVAGTVVAMLSGAAVSYLLYRRNKRKRTPEAKPESAKAPAAPLALPDETVERIMQKLKKFEQSEKYLNPKISLPQLSSSFGINSVYISDTIKKKYGKNFNSYINELRIAYICEKLKNEPEYRNYKLEHLASVSGFSSHSTFTKTFKNITGITPSQYLEEL